MLADLIKCNAQVWKTNRPFTRLFSEGKETLSQEILDNSKKYTAIYSNVNVTVNVNLYIVFICTLIHIICALYTQNFKNTKVFAGNF